MPTESIATIYTAPTDSWTALEERTGVSRERLIALNPHLEALTDIEPASRSTSRRT